MKHFDTSAGRANAMPKSIETSSEFDFSNEPLPPLPPSSNASVGSHGPNNKDPTVGPPGGGGPPVGAGGSVAASATPGGTSAASNCKKYRHQNYSKNIYIGTKNAEKWEKVRMVLSFKNDVEFVSYLLRLSEIDLADNNGLYSRESFTTKTSTHSTKHTGSGKKGSNEKFTTDTDTDQESLPASLAGGSLSSSLKGSTSKGSKKVKRVQFKDGLSPGVCTSPLPSGRVTNRPVTPTIIPGIPILAAARLFESASEFRRESLDNDDEVLDCRIAEKIKTELTEYNKARVEGKNLSLLRDKALELAKAHKAEQEEEEEGEDHEDDGDVGDEGEEPEPMKEEEEDEDEEDAVEGRHIGATEFEKALCLAAAIKQSQEAAKERPVKRKGRPPTKGKTAKEGDGKKRANSKLDIRKAPLADMIPADLRAKLEAAASGASDNDLSDEDEEQFHNNSENSMDSEGGRGTDGRFECSYCDEIHALEECPIAQANCLICDSIEKFRWVDENKDILERIKPDPGLLEAIKGEDDVIGDLLEEDNPDDDLNEASSDEDESTMDLKVEEQMQMQLKRKEEEDKLPCYCDATIPEQVEVIKSEVIGSKVVARTLIPKFMKLGPLVGEIIHVKDIPDDCTMKDVYEINDGAKSYFISTSNKNESNWLRYIRPAPTRDQRNVVIVWCGQPEGNVSEVYFITSKDIGEGCELFYWSDHMNSTWGRKKIDKMNCGGCNLKFEHPLYYRTHCSVFHDPGFSLTIRKYHCKVCGLAVLGKENIMQHAAEMHEGKGAYQCQFCKKYFLRLNYLEMHRTYGCSANPQRARPLCDFCGRKFCQPQKLKVHIKRMHSADMADVLRDFQCKLCSKLLGSRAALQRHSKEVHSRNSAVVSCPRCQKLFQNRSNLKIHMLTHSGVRPFKCAENGCTAAFTTKQCLQFHYKKVHGYTQEQMPKIERSIAYTFDAYSGGMKVDFLAEQLPRRRRKGGAGASMGPADDSKSLMQNFASAINERKRAKANDSDSSLGDLVKNEPNLSLLSSKISSLLSQELKHAKKLKKKMLDTIINNPDSNSANNLEASLFKTKGCVGGAGGLNVPGGMGGVGVAGGSSGVGLSNENLFKMRLFQSAAASNSQMDNRVNESLENDEEDDDEDDDQSKDSILGNSHNNAQINLVETFLNNSTNGTHLGMDAQNSLQLLQNQLSEQAQNPFNAANLSGENSFNINSIVRGKEFMTPSSAALLTSGLIQSKGSKKWMDDHINNAANDHSAHPLPHLTGGQQQQQHHHQHQQQMQHSQQHHQQQNANRNFLSRLMGAAGSQHGAKFGSDCAVDGNDDESSILEVVDNQNGQNKNVNLGVSQLTSTPNEAQQQQQFGGAASFQEQISQLSSLSNLSQYPHNSLANFGNAYCSNQGSELGSSNEGIVGSAAAGSGSVPGNATASLLVEAALNSVTNMIEGTADNVDNSGGSAVGEGSAASGSRSAASGGGSATSEIIKGTESMGGGHENVNQGSIHNPVMSNEEELENVHHMGNADDLETSMRNDSGSFNDEMQEIENEVKLMKSLNNYQMNAQSGPNGPPENMQFPMSQQSSSASSTNGNQNPLNSANSELVHDNDIDVDNASTPRTLDRDSTSFRNYPPTTTPSPRDISPGQDYSQGQRTNDQQQQQQQQQQLFGLQSPIMGRNNSYHHMSDHMGATPSPVSHSNANQHNSSPPILPRYGFSLNDICRKREYGSHQASLLLQQQQQQQQQHQQHQQQLHQARRDHHLSSDEDSIMAQNLSVNHVPGSATEEALKLKANNSVVEQHYSKYGDHMNSSGADLSELRLKYNANENPSSNMDHFQRLQPPQTPAPQHGGGGGGNSSSNLSATNDQMNEIGLDMSSRISGYPHHNFQLSAAAAAAGLNRYHHHIYDILSEREQQQQSSAAVSANQQAHHLQNTNEHQLQLQQEQQQQQQQHMMLAQQQQHEQSHQMSEQGGGGGGGGGGVAGNPDADASDQTTSVDLSRTTSFVVTSPPSLPYAGHPHSDMLRMVSMELNGVNGNANAGNMIPGNNHRTPFLGASAAAAAAQHNTRMDAMESLHHHHHRLLTSAEQHRLLASNTAAAAEQLTNPGTNRLLVDPAHLLMDSNNRGLLSASAADTSRLLSDRHMVQGRDFGSYHHHHHHQVAAAAANNYHHHGAVHHPLARPSAQANHHSVGATNYHPFPTYY